MSEPQPIPVNALFGMDFVSLLVVLLPTDTMTEVGEKVAANVVGKRIARRNAALAVYYQEKLVPNEWTVEQAGIKSKQFQFVEYVDE